MPLVDKEIVFNPIPELWGPMDPRHSKIVAVEKSLHESLRFFLVFLGNVVGYISTKKHEPNTIMVTRKNQNVSGVHWTPAGVHWTPLKIRQNES